MIQRELQSGPIVSHPSAIISGLNHVGSLCSASVTVESAERPTFREKVRPDPSHRLDVELHVAGPCCCQHRGVICKYASWLDSNMSPLIDEQCRLQGLVLMNLGPESRNILKPVHSTSQQPLEIG